MITVTINGKEIKLEKPVTVLEAARSAGIKIPTLCYHEQLEKYGGCRLCLVEVEKMPRLQTACTLMAADGMVVRTETEAIADVRRGVLEFLLINHPLDCPYCDKAGECELQDLVEKYGPTTGRFKEKKRKAPESLEDPVLVRNMERCVVCTRCVRMCEGVQGAAAIGVINRGGHSHVEPFSGGRFECEYCGNCVSACPVGAIMSRLHRHSYRPWQLVSETETICPYCGVGCTLVAQVRDDVIKRVVPRIGTPVNNGLLCSRGRFGYEFVGSKERLTTPLIKKNGVLEQSTWEEAIGFVARRLGELKTRYGGDAIAGIASPRCTNEDNYVFQKFMRVALGTNNIDSTARTGYAGAQAFIENIFGQGATANLIPGLANADAVLIAGGDPTAVNPILGLQIRSCARKGGNILTIGHVKGVRHYNPAELKPNVHTEAALLEGVVTALKEKKGLPGSIQTLESKIKEIHRPLDDAARTCGVTEKDLAAFVEALSTASTPALVIGKEVIQSAGGSYNLLLLSAVAYLVNARIHLLSERANEQGVVDMGCAPDLLPGCRPLSYVEFRRRYEAAWKSPIPEKQGMTIFDMIDAAKAGSLRALYVMGENPVFNLPNAKGVEAALRGLELLVVQDIFMTETARMADVVFPALSWAEREGTFTNMERRLQLLRKAVNREGMEDWRIVVEVAGNMGVRMHFSSAEDIFAEITRVSPLHRDLSYEELEKSGIYPYKGEPLRGVTGDIAVAKPAAGDGGGLFLGIERPLFHSGTLSRRAPGLVKIYETAVARISPATAAARSLKEGDMVRVSSVIGYLELPVAVDFAVRDALVMITNNFEGRGALSLMELVLDPVLRAPVADKTAVTIEKAGR
ncbi:MAG: NADH-quinone oxidoreductase subunit NuoG [Nitrospiraceae bacterium]|nr:NADH-quinone oxidoreductase subunit NuoG [Nitrospiraceae bacterium]